MVTTPFAVLLNNDAVPEPDWLEQPAGPDRVRRGSDGIGATTGKVVFAAALRPAAAVDCRLRARPARQPRARRADRLCRGQLPGPTASRDQLLDEVLWERLTYGAEGPPDGSRSSGPVPPASCSFRCPTAGPAELTFGWAAERAKPVELSLGRAAVGQRFPSTEPSRVGAPFDLAGRRRRGST